MKAGSVTGTIDSTAISAANDIVQEQVTNFTKELFGYIANGIDDDISSIARTMLGEVVEKIDDWEIECFQQSIQDDKISFTIQTYQSEKYSMLSGMRVHILRRNNSYQFIVTINSKNYACSLDNTDINWFSIVCLLNNMTVNDNTNEIAVTESYKPIWDWKISQYNVSDIKFETIIKPRFADRTYFSNCSPVDPTSTRPTYFGDTDGSVGAVLYALFATGHLGIMAEGENFLSQLLNIEEKVLDVLLSDNFNEESDIDVAIVISILSRRDIFLESLQPYLVINKGAVTPCTFLGDQTGDRLSNICGDQFIIDLLKRIMSINENVHVLAGNHETNCNGNYMKNFTRMEPLDEDTYAGIKDYPVCFYDPKYKIMANHHGITFDVHRERYIIGPITVSKNEMTDDLDPVELAAIINKKHHAIINSKKFKNSRAISCQSYNSYFSTSTNYRPKLEAILACSQMLGINQVVAHNGNGGRERIGETGTVLGLNARDSKHAGRILSMHNCQINPGPGPEITAPWKSYQHEKNRNELMPLIRKRTMLQL
ncbi:DUF4049 domain-containing protein [Escherichia coli]|uniref:DUF4049 domain-containing protein n=1 Tax=Escherichia coli TaxID=562 RepID=UPI0038B29521